MMREKVFSMVLLCFVLRAVSAQEGATTSPDEESALDFVVTASRTQEAVSKVSGQVTVITADDIAASGATTVTDVLQTVPGVRIARDNSGAGVDVSMRGITSDQARGKVLVIVDGMRLNPVEGTSTVNWDSINLSDVERIEVLDGGASVQYGDNAQAGVINIITKKSGAAKTNIAVSGGSHFQNEQRFSHHHPTDWGSFTISGGHRGTQGYQKHTASDTGNGELKGIFDINDTMSLQGNVGFAATNLSFASPLTKAQFDDDPTQDTGTASGSISNTGVSAGLGFIWAINETFGFDLPLSYNWQNRKLANPGYSMIMYTTPQMFGIRPKITADLKPADMPLRLTGGVDMLAAFNKTETSYDLVKETNPNTTKLSEFTIGPWVLANFEPFSILSLNAGLRYDAAFIKAHQNAWTGNVMGILPASYTDSDESTNYDAFAYEAGFTVNPLDFIKIYGKYGTQFKYPYLDQLVTFPAPGTTAVSLNTGLEPEEGWTVEGGIGLNFKQFVKLDTNIYYLKIDNEIFADALTWVYMNMDPIDRLGTNVGLKLTPVKYMELDLDYGFVKAEFSDGPNEGKKVPLTAAHTLSGSLMVYLPFGLSLGPNMLFKSEMYPALDYANTTAIDPSLIWGLQARYVINKFKGDLAVQLTVHNLADTKYATLAYMGMIAPNEPAYYVDSNMGRSVNISVQYSF
ncbi:MAG: TonB-dependent receptor [Treponema sp.]|jgi:iron complex outermembrane receptor protein|nr:TonB-dependent receptor [Treponema sp.]